MNVRFDADEVERLAEDLGNAAERATARTRVVIDKTANDTVRSAQIAAPVDTAHLRNSIGADRDPDGLGFEAGPTASYGAHVEFGTTAHIIEPRTKRALYWPGARHPVARVQHPGTAPQPYLLPAFDRQVVVAMQAFERIVADPWPRGR